MLTASISKEIIKAVEVGARIADAARSVGYSPDIVLKWLDEDANFEKEFRKAKSKCKIDQLKRLANSKGWQAPAFLLERKWPKEFGRRRPLPVRESEPSPPDKGELGVDFSDMTPEEMARLDGCYRKPRLLSDLSSAPAQDHDGSATTEPILRASTEHSEGDGGSADGPQD
jgi:hypothetical protein